MFTFLRRSRKPSPQAARVAPRRAVPARSRRTAYRPRLEALEDRVVLATITDLGAVSVTGINDSGQVVGTSSSHAFLYTSAGGMVDLGTLPGYASSRATGINDAGQVVGSSTTLSFDSSHAFLYSSAGGMTDLGALRGGYAQANGINDAGQVVGESDVGALFFPRPHAFLYTSAGGMTDLGTLPGDSFSYALGINDAGQVVGFSFPASGGSHAFLYTSAGGMTGLGTLPGDTSSAASGINDAGQVVGNSGTASGASHAFLYTSAGGMTDLGPGDATAVNDAGQVVGTSGGHAFLYTSLGGMTDLNSQLPAGSGWVLTDATALNNVGQIVGQGTYNGQTHAFLLTLTDTPNVTTPYSREASGPVFGPYLPGAALDVPFTVTDPGSQIQQMKWEISGQGGSAGFASPAAAPGTWTFHFDVGNLQASSVSPHTLTVTALDASGNPVGKPFTAQVDAEFLNLSLKLTGQVGAGSPTDVNQLRFIHSTDPRLAVNETFKGEVVGLPDYYTHSTDVVSLGGAPIPDVKLESTDGNLGFEFDKDAETLPARTSLVAVKVGLQHLSKFGATPQPLVAVKLPSWLNSGTPSFGTQDEAYHFTDVRLPLVKLSIPLAPIDTGVRWLNAKLHGLKTFADLTATVAVTIPLNVTQTPTVDKTGDHLDAQATVLGQQVWQKSYDTSQLEAGGTLDPKTLEASSIFVKLAAPIDLGQKTLIDKTFSATFPVVAPLVSAKATLAVQLVGDLMVDAGIQLGWQNHWVVQSPGTFLTLTATAKAHVEAALDAKVGVGFIEETVQVAKAFLDAKLTISGTATFSGSLLLPSIASTTLQGTLEGDYGFDFLADLLDKKDKTVKSVDEEPTPPDFSIQLFKL